MVVLRFNLIFALFTTGFMRIPSLRIKRSLDRTKTKLYARGFGAKKETFNYTGRLRPGIVDNKLPVPDSVVKPDYALDGIPKNVVRGLPWEITPQTAEDIVRMRVAGRIAREVLDAATSFVKPGIMTKDIDKLIHEETIKRNSYPSPLNYHGFPKSCCTSINEVVCHGIPDSTVLQEGDIVNIDVTIFHDGVHGDCSETVFVGKVTDQIKDLVICTYEAWQAAIKYCRPGAKYSGIGAIIEDMVTAKGYSTVSEFCGHGIGRVFHTSPNVLHYRNSNRGVMAPG